MFTGTHKVSMISKKTVLGDPFYNNVSLLLHMDGTDNSTTFTDSSINNFTMSTTGNTKISTAQSKFGPSSAFFDGSGDFLSAPNNSAFEFGTGDFTIEFWARVLTGYNNAIGVMWHNAPNLLIWSNNGTFSAYCNGSFIGSFIYTVDTWYHIALCRAAGTMRFFINGSQEGSQSDSTNYTGNSCVFGHVYNIWNFGGNIDEVRITKGIARYTSNFTEPSEPFLP